MATADRRCETCGCPLSRYNNAGACGACSRAARSGLTGRLHVPPLVWHDDQVRRALAEWNWGSVLAAAMKHTGASQTQVAAVTGLSQAHVSRLTAGSSECYDIRTVRRIIDGLGVPCALAGLTRPDIGTVVGDGGGHRRRDEEREMKRRTVLTASAVAPFATILTGASTHVSLEQARQVRSIVAELYRLDDQVGGEVVGELASWCVRRVDRILNSVDVTGATGHELRVAYGELAEMAGWLHFDAGRYGKARTYYSEALQAAQLTDDLNLEVLVLASMNTLARYRGRPREAVQLAQLAQRRAAGWAPPRLLALLASREAVCWAQLGDSGSSQAAMRRAFQSFTPDAGTADPPWITFFDSAELSARRATASTYFNLQDQAIMEMRTAVDGLGQEYQRNRAYYSVRLGLLQLNRGDEAGACDSVAPILSLLTTVHSGRTHARFAEFYGCLQRSRKPCTRDLIDQAQALSLVG